MKLGNFDLRETNISDAAIPELAKLNLTFTLDVEGAKITPEGVERLETLLPDLPDLGY